MPQTAVSETKGLTDLVQLLHGDEDFAGVVASLEQGNSGAVDGAWGSSCALVAAALAVRSQVTLLVVLPRIGDLDEFADDVRHFTGKTPLIFPAWESLPHEADPTDAVFGSRLRVLRALAEEQPPDVIITAIPALLQPVPSSDELAAATRTIQVGDRIDLESFLSWLVDRGFSRVAGIEVPGEFALRGGILDLFPVDATNPLRLEFFGDETESIRWFDVETQRTIEALDRVRLTVTSPAWMETHPQETDAANTAHSRHFLDALPQRSWLMLVELQELTDEGKQYLSRLDDVRGLFSVPATLSRCIQFPSVTVAPLAADSMETTCHLQMESIERFTGPKSAVLKELASIVSSDERILIACHNAAEQARVRELLGEIDASFVDRVTLCLGRVARGFRFVRERQVVLGDHELFGRTDVRRVAGRHRIESRAIDSFLELSEGDLVVHLAHGVGRYRGMKLLERDHRVEEHLVIEFRDRLQIYVPASLIQLVQKYVGAAKSFSNLSKLGTTAWTKRKRKVSEAVTDLAVDMLRLQAAREARPGIAHPADSHWQTEFDAAFPYIETDDQIDAIRAIKEDMQRQRPMDRLICGDVGYGKTEVAMRAAFKAIDAGRQVALLVPTTVLAEQHYRTFTERMAEYPISVESLSRFKTKSAQRKTLEAMAAGTVDLVIGTHRLLQQDVQFRNLGLVIIDEEQRFGVAAKEMLKQLRLEVDMLALSATPIPRTLHMSLLGIRDISNLETPPQDRIAIVTRVCRFDPELIRQAVIRELNRNGQIYFVHNRVHNIGAIADRIQRIVPEAIIDIGHGQMSSHDLEAAMLRFVSGRTDVFVCTTIIESGLDIPNANTIFIHCADQFGLADLHQLRGRVGRYKHRAYCYLLLEEGRTVTTTAAKRMKAIEEFSELGAGFKIAMRDLEIRGAGNILGTEQSGHITAVGYELYCHLLENAVRRLKDLPIREHRSVRIDLPVSAFLPPSYVPPGRQKIEMYRKLSNVETFDALGDVQHELRDRFGPLPREATRLLELKTLQLLAQSWQIDEVRLERNAILFSYRDRERIQELVKRYGTQLRVVDERNAYFVLDSRPSPNEAVLTLVKSVLQPM